MSVHVRPCPSMSARVFVLVTHVIYAYDMRHWRRPIDFITIVTTHFWRINAI